MRTLVIVGLIGGAVAVFAPDQGAGLMRSVVHGFGWGIGRESCAQSFSQSSLVTSAKCDRRKSATMNREFTKKWTIACPQFQGVTPLA